MLENLNVSLRENGGVEMDAKPTFEQMHWAVEYRELLKQVRPLAFAVMVITVLVLVLTIVDRFSPAYGASRSSVRDMVVVVVVCVIVLGGAVWQWFRPQPFMLLVGAALGVLVAAAIGVASLQIESGMGKPLSPEALTGIGIAAAVVVAMVYGVLRVYQRLAKLPPGRPEKSWLRWANATIREMKRGKPKRDATLIAFHADSVPWRARLMDDMVLLLRRKRNAWLARRGELEIIVEGEIASAKSLKATFGFADQTLQGKMTAEDYSKYRTWPSG